MKYLLIMLALGLLVLMSCKKKTVVVPTENQVEGYSLLQKLPGHWVGTNKTVYGTYPWFCL